MKLLKDIVNWFDHLIGGNDIWAAYQAWCSNGMSAADSKWSTLFMKTANQFYQKKK